MKKLLVVFVLPAVLALPGFGVAKDGDEGIHELEEIVVTATQKMKMIDTPASISIITAKDLEEMGAKNIIEARTKALRLVTLISMKSNMASSGTMIF